MPFRRPSEIQSSLLEGKTMPEYDAGHQDSSHFKEFRMEQYHGLGVPDQRFEKADEPFRTFSKPLNP